MFSTPYDTYFSFMKCTLNCCLQSVSIWTSLKFCRLVKGTFINVKEFILTHYQTTKYRLFQTESFQMTISNLTKMAESYPNGKKTLRKGEIARYEQFLLFPQCFQKACFKGASKGVIVWEWVNTKKLNRTK